MESHCETVGVERSAIVQQGELYWSLTDSPRLCLCAITMSFWMIMKCLIIITYVHYMLL